MKQEKKFGIECRIRDFEKAIYLNDENQGEVAAIFSSEGRLMCFFAGFSALMIDEKECPQARGGILTHNHVSDTAFSMHDLKTASELELIEIRVVGPSGWYSMKPGPDGWPSPVEISAVYERVSRELSPGTGEENLRELSDAICRKLAGELGIVFEIGVF